MFWNLEPEKNRTLEIIEKYIESTGNTSFTYKDLRSWYYGSGAHKEYKRDWHTIERLLRKLAEEGVLLRYRYGRTVMFVVPPRPINYRILKEMRKAFKNALINRDYEGANKVVEQLSDLTGVPTHICHKVLSQYDDD